MIINIYFHELRAEVNLSMLIIATRKKYSCKVNIFYTFVRVILPCLCFIFRRRHYEPSLLQPVSLYVTSIMNLTDLTDTTQQQKFAIFVEDSYFKIIIQINNLLQLQNIQKKELNIWHFMNIIFLVKFCLYVKFTVSLNMLSSLMDIDDSSSQTMVGNRLVVIYFYCLYDGSYFQKISYFVQV